MKLSYSAISSYRTCPLQYYFRYEEGRPSVPSPALSFGQSVHEALRWLYDVPTPDPPSLDELLDYLEECWVKEGYGSQEERLRYFLHARSLLERYYRLNINERDRFHLPAALEHKFRIEIDGVCELTGVIDRVDHTDSNRLEVIDYKTNRRLPPAGKLKEDLQLPIYKLAAERIWETPVERVSMYFLLHDHQYTREVTESDTDAALAEIERVAALIEDGEYPPRENPLCPWCDYLGDCSVWEGRTSPALRRSTSPPPVYIGEVVDEIIRVEKQVARKLAGLDPLMRIARDYMTENRVERVEGSLGFVYIDETGTVNWCEGLDF